jgi:protein O-mannosyl-transferase
MPKIKKTDTHSAGAFWQICLKRLSDARVPLGVCALSLLVYARSLFCGFVRDDFPQIVHNRQVQSWEYLPQLWGSHLWSQESDGPSHFYRPLFSVWMLLVHTIGGLAPWFWHLSSILLHVLATWLVFRLCRRLTRNDVAAAAAAAIFAVHPIHVDAVTWISASCEVLFTIFALAAMLSLLGGENDRDDSPNPRVWLSALWFSAGIFAKETGIVMLAILPVIAWVQLKGQVTGSQRLWKASFPYGVVTAGYLLIRWVVMRSVGVEIGEHSWAEVVFSAPSILLFYMKKLFLPWNLSGSYVNPLTSSFTAIFWIQLVAIVVSLGAIAWFTFRNRSLFGLAAPLIVIPVLPALAVIRIYQQGDMTHDRYLYLPSVGISLLVALVVQKIWSLEKSAKVMAIAALSAVFLVFSAIAISQQKYYQDDIAFYSRVIEICPSDASAMGMLGNVYLDQGHKDLALEEFQKANQIEPDNQKVTFFLARGLVVVGKYHEAETVLKGLLQSPQLNSNRRESTMVSLANVEIGLGNLNDAQQLLNKVDRSNDTSPQLHWTQGMLYQRQGQLPQALAEYEKEFEITGDELARQQSVSVERIIQAQSARHTTPQSNAR